MKTREYMQSLWIGESLSTMEAVSIQSFLNLGYDYHLYVYEKVANVPSGVKMWDANEIVDRSRIFKYKDFDSYAGFANLFRYTLLYKRGGCWSDVDIFCLRPLNLSGGYLFAGDAHQRTWGRWLKNYFHPDVCNCFMKAPAGNDLCRQAVDFCQARDVAKLRWGETGPELCARLVGQFGLRRYVAPVSTFCAIPYRSWTEFISEDPVIQSRRWREFSSKRVCAVHLWNEMWRRAGLDKNRSFHPSCLYERLKKTIASAPLASR